MKRFNNILFTVAHKASLLIGVALALCACQKEHGSEENFASNEISFSTSLAGVELSRAISVANSPDDITDFGVYATYLNRANKDKFQNIQINRAADGTTSYESGKPLFYDGNESIEFIAYSPYNASANFDAATNTIKYVDYDVTADNQKEPLVAYNVEEVVDNTAHLNFKHTLSALQFKVKGKSDVEIVSMNISYVKTKGTMVYNPTLNEGSTDKIITWTAEDYNPDNIPEFNVPLVNNIADVVLDENNYVNVSESNLIMLPQELPARSCLHIVIRPKGAVEDGSADVSTDMPLYLHSWEPGKLHTYLINAKLPKVEVEMVVSDWKDVEQDDYFYSRDPQYFNLTESKREYSAPAGSEIRSIVIPFETDVKEYDISFDGVDTDSYSATLDYSNKQIIITEKVAGSIFEDEFFIEAGVMNIGIRICFTLGITSYFTEWVYQEQDDIIEGSGNLILTDGKREYIVEQNTTDTQRSITIPFTTSVNVSTIDASLKIGSNGTLKLNRDTENKTITYKENIPNTTHEDIINITICNTKTTIKLEFE